jgi:RNA polymerase sigma factor (sigma-70 family)
MDSKTKQTYATRMTLLQKMQRQHDEAAWQEFVSIYEKYIYGVIFSMNITAEDAGDVLQTVLMKLWKKLPEIDLADMRRFRSYLAVTVKNTTYDLFRRESRRGGDRKVVYEERLHAIEHISEPEVEQIAIAEWENYLSAKAMENVTRRFSAQALGIFNACLNGEDIKVYAKTNGIPLSTAYRLKSRVKEALLEEIKALEEYLG